MHDPLSGSVGEKHVHLLRPSAKHVASIVRAFLPPPSLRRYLICVFERDTRGCAMHPLQSFTYGPAVPTMAIIWIWQGCVERLVDWRPDDLEAPREKLTGPVIIKGGASKPWIQFSDQPVHSLVVLFRPEAMRQLFGLEPADWMDQVRSVQDGDLSARWIDLSRRILSAKDSGTALSMLYGELEHQLGQSKTFSSDQEPELAGDWVAHLHALAPRLSRRSLQLKVKDLTGTTIRQLTRLIRIESLALKISRHYFDGQQREDKRLGDLAAESEFADQAHMNREVRRAAGFGMRETLLRMIHDESFWLYRARLSLHLNPRSAPGIRGEARNLVSSGHASAGSERPAP